MSGKKARQLRQRQGISIQARREMDQFERDAARTVVLARINRRRRENRRALALGVLVALAVVAGVWIGMLR